MQSLKTVGGVNYTNSKPWSVTNRRTDRHGVNPNAPDYRHGGIKRENQLSTANLPLSAQKSLSIAVHMF